MKPIHVAVSTLALLALHAPAAAQEQPIERIKLTDNELGCRQLHAEIGEMEAIAKAARESREGSRTVGTAAEAAAAAAPVAATAAAASGSVGAAFGLSQFAPIANLLGGLAKNTATQKADQSQERLQAATARREHLTGVFVNKGCKASDLDAVPVPPEKPLVVAAAAPAAPAAAAAPMDAPMDAQQALKDLATKATPLEQAANPELLDLQQLGLLGNSPRVAIAGFRVAFATKNSATAYAGSGLANIGQTNRVRQAQNKSVEITLQNVDARLAQAIADQAYADFVARVKATGREVVELDAIKANAGFKALGLAEVEPGKPYTKSPMNTKKEYMVVSPAALPLWFMHLEPMGGVSLNLDNWRAMNQLSADLDAVVLVPTISIDFASVQTSGRSTFGSHAEVGAQAGMSVEPGHTILLAFHAKRPIAGDMGNARLKGPLAVPGEFGQTKEAAASSDAGMVNALTMLTGLQGTQRSSTKLHVVADPARFAERALQGAVTANALFAGAIGKKP